MAIDNTEIALEQREMVEEAALPGLAPAPEPSIQLTRATHLNST